MSFDSSSEEVEPGICVSQALFRSGRRGLTFPAYLPFLLTIQMWLRVELQMTKCLNVDKTPSMVKEHGRGGNRNLQNGYRVNISIPAIPDAFSPSFLVYCCIMYGLVVIPLYIHFLFTITLASHLPFLYDTPRY